MGEPVQVSGLRRPDVRITANRPDIGPDPQRAPLHGGLRSDAGVLRIGTLVLSLPPGMTQPRGGAVIATGCVEAGRMIVDTLRSDLQVSSRRASSEAGKCG
ncbi:hypothetical protein [Sabulicella rubraurantiaca]|uniref:hypothetical protein n=1 Tax=Sabulicella rubraurantiaca TaxID=2811429 RepID=UPI001A968E64|nr:hypothetical protein [Sabulicella rubraurantiaca]